MLKINLNVTHGVGTILKLTSVRYVDQLDSSINPWVGSKRNLITRLRELYNLNEFEYYNLLVRGDKDNYRKCTNSNCNNLINDSISSKHRLINCSQSCQVSVQQSNRYLNGTHVTQLHPNLFTDTCLKASHESTRNKCSLGVHPFQDRKVIHKSSRSRFINRFDNRGLTAYFYLTSNNKGFIKFGITTAKYGRSSLHFNGYKEFYKSIHIIRSGSIKSIAELEYQIKIKFDQYNLDSTEIILESQLKNVLNFIKKYKSI